MPTNLHDRLTALLLLRGAYLAAVPEKTQRKDILAKVDAALLREAEPVPLSIPDLAALRVAVADYLTYLSDTSQSLGNDEWTRRRGRVVTEACNVVGASAFANAAREAEHAAETGASVARYTMGCTEDEAKVAHTSAAKRLAQCWPAPPASSARPAEPEDLRPITEARAYEIFGPLYEDEAAPPVEPSYNCKNCGWPERMHDGKGDEGTVVCTQFEKYAGAAPPAVPQERTMDKAMVLDYHHRCLDDGIGATYGHTKPFRTCRHHDCAQFHPKRESPAPDVQALADAVMEYLRLLNSDQRLADINTEFQAVRSCIVTLACIVTEKWRAAAPVGKNHD